MKSASDRRRWRPGYRVRKDPNPARPSIEALVAAGRSIKLDVKEKGDTLRETLDMIDALGLSDDRVWFNAEIDVVGPAGFVLPHSIPGRHRLLSDRLHRAIAHGGARRGGQGPGTSPLLGLESSVRAMGGWVAAHRRARGAWLGDEHLRRPGSPILPRSGLAPSDVSHRGLQLPAVEPFRPRIGTSRRSPSVSCRSGAGLKRARSVGPPRGRR